EDDFSDPASGWEVGQYDDGGMGYRDGYYFVSATAEDKRMWGLAYRSFGDVVVEVEATQVSAPANNNNAYGMSCRVQDNGDAYHLLIGGDGYYSIQKSESGTFEELVAWTSSDAISQGNATNQLRVVCDGSRLALYCNGELLGEAMDSTWAEGDISLSAASLEPEPTEIHFDNLRAYAPAAAGQPTPTSPVGTQGPVLFEDDFSNPSSGWEVGQYNEGSVGYRDGYYFVTSVQESMRMWGIANQSFSDVDVEVDATQFSGPADNDNAYGVSCRSQSNNDAYNLIISGDGYYSIQRIVDGTFEKIVDWTRSDSINQGNATNHLRAVCDGSRLVLYCNGQLLAETTDSTFTSGDIALMVVTYDPEATEVYFDNLKVYEPAP
ncbi:MAG: hypothetical protein OEV76_09175, partial [Anaerolineae bacterium]|nr:hypothetical protein [Anaerolineae bacterium]